MSGLFKSFLFLFLIITITLPNTVNGARIKDIASVKGIRANQLFGYGLVIGLNGSGDKDGTTFTVQGLVNMLEKMGIRLQADDVKIKNVAAVMVNAMLPPFARIGKKIDVIVSSIGDAKSLQGGTLLLTPLKGVDGKVYAIAQGPISVGGYSAGGAAGGGVTKNHPTVARISSGATIEREISFSLKDKQELTLILNNPDFTTATRAASAINLRLGVTIAKAVDSGTLKIAIPENYEGGAVSLLAQLEDTDVSTDSVAKVIVNEKTGTVVIGENVRLSTVAVAHGNLSIEIKETKYVSQPQPFSPRGGKSGPVQMEEGTIVAPGGSTVVTPDTSVAVEEEKKRLLLLPKGNTIGELVRALNAVGVTPRDLITILQAMKAAGALQASLEII